MAASNLALLGVGGAVSSSFSPSSLPNLMVWYDFSQQAGADSSAISSVSDLSGNSHTLTQSTGTNQPLLRTGANGINGLNAAQFDGTNDWLSTAAFANGASVSLFVVFKLSATSAFSLLATHQSTTWATPFAAFAIRQASGAGAYEAWVEDANVGTNFVSGGTPSTTTQHQIGLTYDQSTEALFLDGTSLQSKSRTGALTARSADIFSVGGRTGGSDVTNGLIGEVICYTDGKNTTDRQSVESYLRSKWSTP